MRKTWGLIPARLESSRLPGKALLDICGYPLIVHVALRSKMSTLLDEVIVCTDSRKIAITCAEYEIPVVLTKSTHKNGTERIAEAAEILGCSSSDLIVDIQGDEALVNPHAIDRTVEFFNKNNYDIVVPFNEINDGQDVNRVKIVESGGKVLYMSRSPVPMSFNKETKYKKHLSTVVFSLSALLKFADNVTSELESIEGVELLRALEIGLNIGTFFEPVETVAVDTANDHELVVRKMRSDLYYGKY